ASFLRVSASRSASLTIRSACSSARPTVSAAMRLRLATHTAYTAAAATTVTIRLISNPKLGNTPDVLVRRPGRHPLSATSQQLSPRYETGGIRPSRNEEFGSRNEEFVPRIPNSKFRIPNFGTFL